MLFSLGGCCKGGACECPCSLGQMNHSPIFTFHPRRTSRLVHISSLVKLIQLFPHSFHNKIEDISSFSDFHLRQLFSQWPITQVITLTLEASLAHWGSPSSFFLLLPHGQSTLPPAPNIKSLLGGGALLQDQLAQSIQAGDQKFSYLLTPNIS